MMWELPDRFKRIDPSDMYSRIFGFPDQMEEAITLGRKIQLTGRYTGVASAVLVGMGGSAIAGDMAAALVAGGMKVPWQVVRGYRLPSWVNEQSLVVCLSYSGGTEETLSCLEEARERGAKVAGITSGGELKERLSREGDDYVIIPGGYPPRAALGFLCLPLVYFLGKIHLISNGARMDGQLQGAVSHVKALREQFYRARDSNPAYRIAKSISNSIPVIYGSGGITGAAALRFRGQLEENAKTVAFHHLLPEMNHNEIVGYENNPDLIGQISILWLLDREDHPQVGKRRELTRDLIGRRVKHQIDIEAEGANSVERLFHLVHLADWVSFWVAMCHQTDPTPVERIERLKQSLSRQL